MLRSSLMGAAIALPMAAVADTTLVSGFNSWEWTSGVLPWGSHTDHGSEYYQSWNSEFGSGYLTLHSIWNTGGHRYESGTSYCNTQVPNSGYNYVTVDLDMYVPVAATKGCWPAFWLDSAWNWPPEIDIAEFKGDGTVWQNVIGTDNNWKVVRTGIDASQWHHYGLALGPANGGNRTYQLFLDGSIKNQGTFPDNQGVPFWIICNYAMEGDSGSPGPTYNTYVQYHNLNVTTHTSAVGNGTYKLIARHSGLAMDAYNQGTGNGTQIIQWTYWGGAGQKWTVTDTGNGYYKIIGVQSGKSLDVDYSSGGTANGTKVQLWDYWNGPSQQFKFAATDSGYYRITPNCATGSCLDVAGISTSAGAKVQLWQWLNGYNQQWSPQAP